MQHMKNSQKFKGGALKLNIVIIVLLFLFISVIQVVHIDSVYFLSAIYKAAIKKKYRKDG